MKKYIKLLVIAVAMVATAPQGIHSYILQWTYGTTHHVVVFDIHGVLADNHNRLIPEGAQLLQRCAHAGHTVMILSNGGFSTIGSLFLCYYNEVARYIKPEHIFMAGHTKKVKPSPHAYQQVLAAIAQNPAYAGKMPPVVFIDDDKMNAEAATKHGIQGLHLDNGDYAKLEQQLQALKVLPGHLSVTNDGKAPQPTNKPQANSVQKPVSNTQHPAPIHTANSTTNRRTMTIAPRASSTIAPTNPGRYDWLLAAALVPARINVRRAIATQNALPQLNSDLE